MQAKDFTTIDDLRTKADEVFGDFIGLIEGIKELQNRKHPLVIRRGVGNGKGVSSMTAENEKESMSVKAGGRTYFFDVQKTREGKPYLTISESRYMGKDKERERNTITVFPEQIDEFSQTLYKIIKIVKN